MKNTNYSIYTRINKKNIYILSYERKQLTITVLPIMTLFALFHAVYLMASTRYHILQAIYYLQVCNISKHVSIVVSSSF